MQGRIFLSYRREDASGWAQAMYKVLCEHFDHSHIFMDVDTLEPGEDFVEVIENAVSSCDIFIALIGKRWLSSKDESGRRIENPYDWVRLEISAALNSGIRVVPVLVDGATMPRPDELPEALSGLARRHAFEVRHARFDTDANHLVAKLKKALGIGKSVPEGEKPQPVPGKMASTRSIENGQNSKASPRSSEDTPKESISASQTHVVTQEYVDQRYAHFRSWGELVGEAQKQLTGKHIARQMYQERMRRIQRDGKPAGTQVRFDYLGRSEKRDYYLAADGLPYMLSQVGHDVRLAAAGTPPQGLDLSDDEVDLLARQEHERFRQFWTVAEGWTHGPQVDPVRQTSPYLISYDELPKAAKIYYWEAVHTIPVVLRENRFQICRPNQPEETQDPHVIERLFSVCYALAANTIERTGLGAVWKADRKVIDLLQIHLSASEFLEQDSNLISELIRSHTDRILTILRQNEYGLKRVHEGEAVSVTDFDEGEIQEMAKAHHTLWKWTMVMQGWVYRPQKNVKTRTSPYLLPWDELPVNVKEYHLLTVRLIPQLLAEAGYEIFRKRP